MSSKKPRISALVEAHQGQTLDAHYLGFVDCFNRQLYFEAHEVLEQLWLADRTGPNGAFYKGLIQLAGAFVHVQKRRPGPAAALLRLAESNLRAYSEVHEALDVRGAILLIGQWRTELESPRATPPTLDDQPLPRLSLLHSTSEKRSLFPNDSQ